MFWVFRDIAQIEDKRANGIWHLDWKQNCWKWINMVMSACKSKYHQTLYVLEMTKPVKMINNISRQKSNWNNNRSSQIKACWNSCERNVNTHNSTDTHTHAKYPMEFWKCSARRFFLLLLVSFFAFIFSGDWIRIVHSSRWMWEESGALQIMLGKCQKFHSKHNKQKTEISIKNV